jgi:antitoxin component of RelBE/YafQ-DinJ toxin-antitoxin module
MNATVAVNLFARAVIREKRIPFEIIGSEGLFSDADNESDKDQRS